MAAVGIYCRCECEEVIEKAISCEKSQQNASGQQFLIITREGKLIYLKTNEGKKKQFPSYGGERFK